MHPLGEPEFAGAELAEYIDAAAGSHRLAAFRDGEAQACIFVGPLAAAPSWDALRPLFGHGVLAEEQRRHFLSGRRVDGQGGGPIVCSCFGVGLTTLRSSIAARTATTVEEIGKALRAGTNCGSCLPELKRLLVTEAAAVS
jgi:assimilatory nitrate reductase catalytic subunit